MGSFSIWHWLIVIFWLLLVVYPIAKILRKAGFSGWWAILSVIPIVNFIGLWILALVRWPERRRDGIE